MLERQELHCHNCGNYVQFDMDMSMNGNHVLKCPVCGHEHCRVVKDGVITDDRWDSRNGNSLSSIPVYNMTFTTTSTFTAYVSSSNTTGNPTMDNSLKAFYYGAWVNTSNNSNNITTTYVSKNITIN
jgi:hypothetical protein